MGRGVEGKERRRSPRVFDFEFRNAPPLSYAVTDLSGMEFLIEERMGLKSGDAAPSPAHIQTSG
jgi:hypothetical protein